MKKNYVPLFFLMFALISNLHSQVVFLENFQNGMPSNFTLINNDGKMPASAVSYVNKAWVIRADFDDATDSIAVSTSWYNPVGQADDWMITPAITVATGNLLTWQAKAQDALYPDGYNVKLSTTGTSISDFTTTLFTINAENSTWTTRSVDVSSYSGQTVYIAFQNNSNDQFLLLIDDIMVYTPVPLDLAVTKLNLPKYSVAGQKQIAGTVQNLGGTVITSFTLKYSVNGGTAVSQIINGLNIPNNGTYNFTHNIGAPMNTAGLYDVDVWIEAPNGGTDGNATNDNLNAKMSIVSSAPAKKVLVEEYTGAWCGWCPDGALKLQEILDNNVKAIGISIHDGDDMDVPAGLTVSSAYNPAFPTGMIDRVLFDGQTEVPLGRTIWSAKTTERESAVVPASVSLSNITYDFTTRQLSVDVNATFYGPVIDEARLNVFIKEDKVTGTGSGYDQVNYYSNNTTYPNHPFYSQPDPIVGYVHNHTLRAMLGGAWGSTGSVPSNVADGQTISKTFTFTMPASWKVEDIHLQGILQEYNMDPNQRNILNSSEIKLSTALAVTDHTPQTTILDIYPNPMSSTANIEFALDKSSDVLIELYSITGQKVADLHDEPMNAGFHTVRFTNNDLSSGVYFIKIKTNNGEAAQRVIITK